MYQRYLIRPLEHGIDRAQPSIHMPYGFSPWALNGRVKQKSFQKRWGYSEDRDLGTAVYAVVLFQMTDGTRFTLYLTATDLCKKEIGTGKTFSYLTDTYVTPGTVLSLDGTKKIVTGTGTTWSASGVKAGDKFIIDDDHTADEEPAADWATISSVDTDEQITLSAAYTGTGTLSGTHKIRKLYTLPSGERWSWAIVGDKFCFTNGSINTVTNRPQTVQYWAGSNYATSLDATNAVRARYCAEYANRLILADCYLSSIRMPLTVKWSAEGNPAQWDVGTYPTAGENDFLETDDFITGLGRVGANLMVYKRDTIHIGYRTGEANVPIVFPDTKPGTGLIAPYSLLEAEGTNWFLSRSDFYVIQGSQPVTIDGLVGRPGRIAEIFFDMVDETEAQNTWGFFDNLNSELIWVANTSAGQYAFVYNIRTQEWYVYRYADFMMTGGKGAI